MIPAVANRVRTLSQLNPSFGVNVIENSAPSSPPNVEFILNRQKRASGLGC